MAVTGTPGSEPESNARIDDHEAHDILQNERRRRVLEHLLQRVGTVTVREVAEEVAAEETGTTPPPTDARWSVYNSLNQTHLPKLDRRGIVDYDRDRKTIELRPAVRQLDEYLTDGAVKGLSWAAYYRALGTLALVFVVASQLPVPVVGDVDVLVWSSLFLACIATSTAYQCWTDRWLYLQRVLT